MPHAMPAWPQALPRGPCDAQPRIYHGPSDFRLWAPSGSTARARNARLLAQALACCLHARRPAFRPLDEGLRGHEKTRGGLRPRNSEKSIELRLYINKGLRGLVFQRIAQRPLATLAHDTRSMLPYIPSPSSPDRVTAHAALRSRIARDRVYEQEMYPQFSTRRVLRPPRPLAPPCVTPPIYMHRSRRPPAERTAV